MYLNVLADQFLMRTIYHWDRETRQLLWGIPRRPVRYSDTESEPADTNLEDEDDDDDNNEDARPDTQEDEPENDEDEEAQSFEPDYYEAEYEVYYSSDDEKASDNDYYSDYDSEPDEPLKVQIDRDEMACMSLACAFGDLEIINQILENDHITLDGEMRLYPLGHPLQAAVRQDQKDIVRILLDRGSEIERRDVSEADYNLLEDAVLSNRLDMLRMLLEFAKTTDNFKQVCEWALCMACYCGNVEAFKVLLEEYGPPWPGQQKRESALVFLACWASSLPLVQHLFSRYPGLDPNSRWRCAMYRCSSDSNPRFTTWVGVAASRGNVPLVQFLLDRGGDPNLALSAAAAGGSVRCLELLVKAGATWDPNGRGHGRRHPLAAAGLGGQYPAAIEFLLENGFSPMDDPTHRFVTTDKLDDEERRDRSPKYKLGKVHDHRPWERCYACIVEILIPREYDFKTAQDWAWRRVP